MNQSNWSDDDLPPQGGRGDDTDVEDPLAPFRDQMPWATQSILNRAQAPDPSNVFCENSTFFSHGSLARGAASLVARSQSKLSGVNPDLFSPSDCCLTMDIACLIHSLSPDQQELAARAFKGILKRAREGPDVGYLECQIPDTVSAFRNRITEGANSIVHNVPVPVIEMVDGHPYASIRGLVEYLFAMGIPIEPLPMEDSSRPAPPTKIRRLADTEKSHEIVKRCLLIRKHTGIVVIPFVIWLDDCDTASSLAMANRAQAWVFTGTFGVPYHRNNCSDNTFLIALGKKGKSHEAVLRKLKEELEELSSAEPNYAYHAGLQRNIEYRLEIYCGLMDTLEQRPRAGLLGHNSNNHPRWGYTSALLAPADGQSTISPAAITAAIANDEADNCNSVDADDEAGNSYDNLENDEEAAIDDNEAGSGHGSNKDKSTMASVPGVESPTPSTDLPVLRQSNSEAVQGGRQTLVTQAAYKSLISCDHCYKARLHREQSDPVGFDGCQECADFDFDSPGGLLKGPVPNDHPTTHLPDKEAAPTMEPKRIKFEACREACEKVCQLRSGGVWNDKQCGAYLKRKGIALRISSEVLAYVEHCKDEGKEEEDIVDGLADEVLPALWSLPGVTIEDFVDVPMHLIFLGVVKSMTILIIQWLKAKGLYSAFTREFGSMLDTVMREGSSVSWLKLRSFGNGKMGGWISENQLGFARLYKWFFGALRMVAPDPLLPEPNENVTPLDKWRKKDLENWLKNRNMKHTARLKAQLVEQVQKAKAEHGGDPPKVGQMGGQLENVERVVSSLSSLVSLVMQEATDDSHLWELDRAVKLFLAHIETVDADLRGAKEKPLIVSSPNFLSLLNLPAVIRKYGPVRLYWEGGGMGEGILKEVKACYSGCYENWPLLTMTKFYQSRSLQTILAALRDEQDEGTSDACSQRIALPTVYDERSFRTLCSLKKAQELLATGRFVTGLVLDDDCLVLVVRIKEDLPDSHQSRKECRLCKVDLSADSIRQLDSFYFRAVVADYTDEYGKNEQQWAPRVRGYFGLLPALGDKGVPRLFDYDGSLVYRYAVMTSMHKEMNSHKQLHVHTYEDNDPTLN